ncbi:MAG: C4-dicarboxylate ABC transporter [Rickettsiales bacterium]|nr:C4-dicarboxylate ABC transporter [Rickettsiales bacterium]
MEPEYLSLIMVGVIFSGLVLGYPVAFTLGGVALLFAFGASFFGLFNLNYLNALPGNIYGTMTSDLLIAVPLFVFMGVVLERAKIAEELLETMAGLCGSFKAGLGISVLIVGAMLAASTGIVGATVVTMGLISLPSMLKNNYCAKLSCGTICAAGTLGQIIPPSIVLILLADQISNSWQTAQLNAGIPSPIPVSVADLFVAAIIPGFALVALYMLWQLLYSILHPTKMSPLPLEEREAMFANGKIKRILKTLMPPLLLIMLVLGSILGGVATATESAAVGAIGAMILAACRRQLSYTNLRESMLATMNVSAMVFTILIGAGIFTIVFRGLEGDLLVTEVISDLPGGLLGAMLVTMLVMFLLGFFLDFIQIIFVVVPIVAPVLLMMGADPIWLAIMMAVNLQTSFLTPPFGFSLFYLRGVAPASVKTIDIYRGVVPFVLIQILMLVILSLLPAIATAMPEWLYGTAFEAIDMSQVDTGTTAGGKSWSIDF